jgi:hypothetical protein
MGMIVRAMQLDDATESAGNIASAELDFTHNRLFPSMQLRSMAHTGLTEGDPQATDP